MTASRDWTVIIWDLATGRRLRTIRFDAPVLSAVLHPRNCKILVVVLQNRTGATLVDLREELGGRFELEVIDSDSLDEAMRGTETTSSKKRK